MNKDGKLEIVGLDSGKIMFRGTSTTSISGFSFEMNPDEADQLADNLKVKAQWCRNLGKLKPPPLDFARYQPPEGGAQIVRDIPVKPEDRQWGHHYCHFCAVEIYTNDGRKTWWHALTGKTPCDTTLTFDGGEHNAEPMTEPMP